MYSYQNSFHQQWQHLHDPHVRALAWLLTSPNLLACDAPQWGNQIASIHIADLPALNDWLSVLDAHPAAMHQALETHKQKRLGHYAEDLLAFYLKHRGDLYARNLQVNPGAGNTIGEFDFLLQLPSGLLHWEIATKFYLFYQGDQGVVRTPDLYDYLGPNLVDTLGAKMHKIVEQQLALSQNMTAKLMLSQPVMRAQALVKGWLFYHTTNASDIAVDGINVDHCRGYWWTLNDVESLAIPNALVLPRLAWLAPAQCHEGEALNKPELLETLGRLLARDNAPVMVAIMRKNGEVMQEICRGLVIPDEWRVNANDKQQQFR